MGDGSWIRISTDEGPLDSLGYPSSFGYFGQCYTRLGTKSCKSCLIKFRKKNRDYAQFDSINLRKDGCAKYVLGLCITSKKLSGFWSEQVPELLWDNSFMNATIAVLEPLEVDDVLIMNRIH